MNKLKYKQICINISFAAIHVKYYTCFLLAFYMVTFLFKKTGFPRILN